MKKSAEIIGLPIISISEGIEIGTSKALVINPVQGAVAAIVVQDAKWYLGAKILPFASVTGIGEHALTIDDSSTIMSVNDAPDIEKLLIADVKVIGAKIVTKTGMMQGKITEINIEPTGKIISCEVDHGGELTQLPAQRVLTYGKDVVIILDADATIPAEDIAPIAAKPPVSAPAPIPVIDPQPAIPVTSPPEEPKAAEEKEQANDESSKKFEDKQRKYLLGKKASKRIETDNGVVIVEAGGDITEEVIQKAKLAGKFVELSMSI